MYAFEETTQGQRKKHQKKKVGKFLDLTQSWE